MNRLEPLKTRAVELARAMKATVRDGGGHADNTTRPTPPAEPAPAAGPTPALDDQTDAARRVWEFTDDETYRRDQSHWRGVGRWVDDTRWRRIGENARVAVDRTFRFMGRPERIDQPAAFLEWGPGGGANLFGLADRATAYFGVDVSQQNLDEAARMIRAEGHDDLFRPILLTAEPSSVVDQVDRPIDVIISTAVFQHFPSKAYGLAVLDTMHRISAPDAIAILQIRFDNGNERFRPIASLDEYEQRHITATSYPIDEFSTSARHIGFECLFVRGINSDTNYCTFHLRAMK